jgi:hypothetical protein
MTHDKLIADAARAIEAAFYKAVDAGTNAEGFIPIATAALASSEKLIAELEARIARKDALLKPFADSLGTVAPTDFTRWPDDATIEMDGAAEMITWGDLRRARAALNEDKPHD